MILDSIKQTNDVKKIPENELDSFAAEIRSFLIEKISVTGGHLASNLGTVELTIALHRVLNLPDDKIIWDVGHQSYTHKILTGRKEGFEHLRQYGGLSGFPKKKESETDVFETGHASDSISAGLGLVCARDLAQKSNTIVSVIGDGALTGGMAYEALNNAAKLNTNFIIILNDNDMSISENTGGMKHYLDDVRTMQGYLNLKRDVYKSLDTRHRNRMISGIQRIKNSFKQLFVPGMFFENLGITYLGPVDGHDIRTLSHVFSEARKVPKAVIIHVITKKGKGFAPAENHPARFHGTEPYRIDNGVPTNHRSTAAYQDIFSTVMFKLGMRNPKVVAVTAAMSEGTGLKRFCNKFPDRFFDVGIAEQHAVAFCAGLALGGFRPVFAVYSSFLQRAYDQLIEDVCLQKLPVVFAIDRAGLVGADGETHQGIFDLSYLTSMPNMTVMAPKNKWELSDMMKFAVKFEGPIAIRYARGEAYSGLEAFRAPIELGRAEPIVQEKDILLFALGSMVKTAEEVRRSLKERGLSCSLANARFAKPLDFAFLSEAVKQHSLIVTMEENVVTGGFGSQVREYVDGLHVSCEVLQIAIPDTFVTHGSPELLKQKLKMDGPSITERILFALKEKWR